ncbi:MAG TPA: hypothetical protein VHU84_03770 [Lacipirellulaceae bacterium]|jgi:hypothetical protein|nr:hypothetical protein [Lacipirellulaceae bacterium]
MVNFPGRDRRRRVLKDEVLGTSSSRSSSHRDDDVASDAPRYTDAAGVENHPQITDFVPRRYRTIATLLFVGVGTSAALTALNYFALPLASAAGMRSTAALSFSAPGSLASWMSAVIMLISAASCLLTYSIRRHRINDFRGRYRVWLGATLACLMMSANSVTGIHQVLADVLGHATGWSALRDGAAWWFVVPGLPICWIMVRAMFDMRECRLSTALLAAAGVAYATSAVCFLGLVTIADPQIQSLTVGASLLTGHWFLLASVVTYSRFVVLDAQGLIAVRRPTVSKRNAKTERKATAATSTAAPTKAATVLSATGYSRPTIQVAKTPADSSRWVDGSRPERKRYESDDEEDESGEDRKISKSDRKRLRKLKTEGRAA